jgi:hypothetical protein
MKKSTVAVLLGCSIALTASITSLNAQSSSSSSRVINQDDFTSAAESTVNGVVSVKSYATPRSQYSNYSSNVPDDFKIVKSNSLNSKSSQKSKNLNKWDWARV